MRFQPITEDEAKESQKPGYILKPGLCDFDVKAATTHVKEHEDGSTSESIKLTLTVWDQDGKEANVFDFLTPGMAFKFRHACYAVGLGHAYESGEVEAEMFNGKGGQLKIRTKQDRGYGPKNDVADYVVSEQTKEAANYQTSKDNGSGAVALEREKRAAWEAFKAKHADKDKTMLETHWRQAIAACFNGRLANTLGAVEWKRFIADGFEPAKSPIGAAEEFKEDDIPF